MKGIQIYSQPLKQELPAGTFNYDPLNPGPIYRYMYTTISTTQEILNFNALESLQDCWLLKLILLNALISIFLYFVDPKYTPGDPATHHRLEFKWTVLQLVEHHLCDWGDDQGPDKIGQQTHCCPLQWYSDSQWNVLCHCNHHWEMQDRGSGGCVPGRQGSTSTETRGCAHCGELERKKGELARKKNYADVAPSICRMTTPSFLMQSWCSWNPLSPTPTFSRPRVHAVYYL